MLDNLPSLTTQKFKQYVATISVSLGAFCAGTVLSWTSPGLAHITIDGTNKTNGTFPTDEIPAPGFKITKSEEALVGAMLTIGALISAIPTGYLADKFGRKLIILGLSIPFLLNYLLISFAYNVETVVAGRFFAGIGLGGICVVAPMYIGEISEPSNRGMFGSFFQMFLSCGILFTCIIGSFANWMSLSLILAVAPVVFGVSFLFMPETPVYLVEKSKLDEAEKTLKELRGSSYDVSVELKTIQKEIMESREKKATLADIISDKANLRATLSVIGVLAFQQFSGINAVVFYTVAIFKAAGSNISPSLSAIIINLVQVVVSYISILIIEKANRKFYLMMSSSGMMLCLAGLGMFFHLKSLAVNVDHLGFIPLGSTVLFMICFSIGYGPVPWMLISELFSPEIKGIASGLAILANWVFAFIVTYSFPIINANLGDHVTFYIFASVMVCATIFVHFVVPETRGKSLLEIQDALNR
ncbi:facilitated trehalose transporter Tret1-like isoform X2 [Anoplophora glabripennis]|nr:facilitated trehalose transporter Tret1-like isoform X2 [Anoplophora glabripennis]XP_018576208.1 facilitated trehalose transporter Tret1-like isoform X2 [Anoplophora glabripennis]XP_018576209.1 facilitated trehalose transporter Tret1-like isoform X2 [Anoplophora glabripennis]